MESRFLNSITHISLSYVSLIGFDFYPMYDHLGTESGKRTGKATGHQQEWQISKHTESQNDNRGRDLSDIMKH